MKGNLMINFRRLGFCVFVLFFVFLSIQKIRAESSFNMADLFPFFSAEYSHEYLKRAEIQSMKSMPLERKDRLNLSTSIFYQCATQSNDGKCAECELWDARGPWNMLGMTYDLPAGMALSPTLTAVAARTYTNGNLFNQPERSDLDQKFGFFSVAGKYRKVGLRFDVQGRITECLGISFKTGFADVSCTDMVFKNLIKDTSVTAVAAGTGPPGFEQTEINEVSTYLMDLYKDVAEEMDLNIGPYSEKSLEDLHLSFFWKKSYIRHEKSKQWPTIIFSPFVAIQGSVGSSTEKNSKHAFYVSTGNQGHHSIGATTGMVLDFAESVEVGFALGIKNFLSKNVPDMFVPTSSYQNGIYPFKTAVKVKPGNNYFFEASLGAYHFLDKLSVFVQYMYEKHSEDSITLTEPNEAFKPECLNINSTWTVHMLTSCLNYDITPNLVFGFSWQAPMKSKKTFGSNTFMLTLKSVF